jgi:hypothetical protein
MYYIQNSDSWNLAILVFVVLILILFWIHNFFKVPEKGVKSIIS